jgi:hypothetical protein
MSPNNNSSINLISSTAIFTNPSRKRVSDNDSRSNHKEVIGILIKSIHSPQATATYNLSYSLDASSDLSDLSVRDINRQNSRHSQCKFCKE